MRTLTVSLLVVVLLVSCKPFTKKEEKSTAFQPTTFVLVHSAWLGSWQWDAVKQELEAAGHHVITPDLPGMVFRKFWLQKFI